MALQSNEATPATTRTYEIQKYAGGRWMLDSVADDKKVAIAMATALAKSGRAAGGVQVMAVQQTHDGQFSEVRIYRATANGPQNSEPQPREPKVEVKDEPKISPEQRDFKHTAHPQPPAVAKKSRAKDIIMALKVAFGVGLTAAAVKAWFLVVH